MAKLLVVEDDEAARVGLADFLKRKNYAVDAVGTGEDAVSYLTSFDYDILILDWDLPDLSGVEVLSRFRARGGQTPVIMLTGKSAINEKELGFAAGADDYLTKPFHDSELAARIVALLRRPLTYSGSQIQIKSYKLDTSTHQAWRDGSEIVLQPMEYALLEFLMRHPDQVFSMEAIIKRCWGADTDLSTEALYSCVKRLRKKIDTAGQPSLSATVHGIGYRLDSK